MRTHEDLALFAFFLMESNRILCLARRCGSCARARRSQIAVELECRSAALPCVVRASWRLRPRREAKSAIRKSVTRAEARFLPSKDADVDRNCESPSGRCRRQYRNRMALARGRSRSLHRSLPAVCVVLDRGPSPSRNGQGLSFKAAYQLLPLGMLGFLLNLTTGMLFFLALRDST